MANGQQSYSDRPLNAEFITTDYDKFWEVFDKMDSSSRNPFLEYLNNASEGLKPFLDYLHADSLYQTVLRRKNDPEFFREKLNSPANVLIQRNRQY
jgi:hypothetical protein